MRAIATAGVGVAHAEIVSALRGRYALFGFDIDHRSNQQVCRQLGKLFAEREQDAQITGLTAKSDVVVWEGPKGIDEAARENVTLRIVSTAEWGRALSGKPLEEVLDVLSDAP